MAAHSKRLIVLIAVLIAGLQAPGYAGVDGRPATRIVSLVPAVTEMLFAVGAGSQVVAVSSFDTFPPEAANRPRVGALLDPDVERILALRPDLVVTYASQIELERQLARARIRTFTVRHGGIAAVLETLRDIGRVSGHAAEGERQARAVEDQLAAIRNRVRNRPRPKTVLVFGRQPGTLQQVYVSGGEGFLNEILEAAGGSNVFADVKRESVQPSHETLIVRAPEAIVELRATGLARATDAQEARRTWSILASIPAVRSERIHVLVGAHLVIPGPRIAMAAEAMARVLHPEAYK